MLAMGGAPTSTGSTALSVFAGHTAGVFVDGALGGGARVEHRLSPVVALGADALGRGALPDKSPLHPRSLFAGRANVQLNPLRSETLALTFGAGGGGTNNQLMYLTADVSVRVSARFPRRPAEGYLAGLAAVSVPVERPRDTDTNDYSSTLYLGVTTGALWHLGARSDVFVELPLLFGFSAHDAAFLWAPTVGFRYVFGGVTGR